MPYKDPAKRLAWQKEYHLKNKAKRNQASREHYYNNRSAHHEKAKEWKRNNPEKYAVIMRRYHLKKSYGLTDEQVPKTCEICSSTEIICVDHSHKSGIIRGFLCRACNVVLGIVKEDSDRLRNLADYLDKHENKDDSNQAA